MERHFVRINDKYIRFNRVKSIKVNEYFETDSMAVIEIDFTVGYSKEEIVLTSEEWISGLEAENYFRPKIKKIIDLIESAISETTTNYEIEI